jgi:hypothetical protein
MGNGRKKNTGKEQVDESYQNGNIESKACTFPSVKRKNSGSDA